MQLSCSPICILAGHWLRYTAGWLTHRVLRRTSESTSQGRSTHIQIYSSWFPAWSWHRYRLQWCTMLASCRAITATRDSQHNFLLQDTHSAAEADAEAGKPDAAAGAGTRQYRSHLHCQSHEHVTFATMSFELVICWQPRLTLSCGQCSYGGSGCCQQACCTAGLRASAQGPQLPDGRSWSRLQTAPGPHRPG